nr:antibiotic biosynthesis monooxygenase [uncultured Celeribacter sp.]
MTFIAMNRFKVAPGREADFEEIWRNREGRLKGLPGFVEFRLLKGPQGEGYTLYSSHTLWANKEDFEGWTKSEAFRASHRNAGQHKDVYVGPPQFEGFETVLVES